MISTSDFQTGLTIEVEGDVYAVLEFQHVKPGKGAAFVRSKLRNLRTGTIMEKTFRAGEKVNKAHLERREVEYLYRDDEGLVAMDMENFDQITLTHEQLEGKEKYLKENDRFTVVYYQDQIIDIEVPLTVVLKVAETEPGVKGDTASGGSKPATLETGLVVQVPFFINEGDLLKIDTRSGEYVERVK